MTGKAACSGVAVPGVEDPRDEAREMTEAILPSLVACRAAGSSVDLVSLCFGDWETREVLRGQGAGKWRDTCIAFDDTLKLMPGKRWSLVRPVQGIAPSLEICTPASDQLSEP